jgi:DNA-3-methyladenine glycosylase I
MDAAACPRCAWAHGAHDQSYHDYHDQEWGVPQHDDHMLFEMLTLEGAQAGLSWRTILNKRAGYRALFAGFDPAVVAGFDAARVATLLADARIVRHRGKIESTIGNAAAFLAVQREFGSFAAYLWGFVEGKPVVTRRPMDAGPPARTELSDRISADLRRRGFRFVGSTIIYAYLQATGVVDDHQIGCFRATPG